MLKTKDILDNLDLIDREQYGKMISMVNIPDFTKCVAQFAGINLPEVKDKAIEKYLITWAKNKYKYFKMFGEKLVYDTAFAYNQTPDDLDNQYRELEKQFPKYALWLDAFKNQETLKIQRNSCLEWRADDMIRKLFPTLNLEGVLVTHFFKKYLQAEDDIVTEIGKIYENTKINAMFTMSIDPVDMMLASDNPYNWVSCYRLSTEDREGSHADGCMAAVLDKATVITYVWNNHGKFTLYDKYKFTDIRYKRMRMWLAFSDDMTSIHFNDIYPGKSSYDRDFCKTLRGFVEEKVCEYLEKPNKWKHNFNGTIERIYPYGYCEYNTDNVYSLVSAETNDFYNEKYEIAVFDEPIEDALLEGTLLGNCQDGDDWDYENENSYDEDSVCYNGRGFLSRNFKKQNWCPRGEEYCSYMDDCGHCGNADCYYYKKETSDEDED